MINPPLQVKMSIIHRQKGGQKNTPTAVPVQDSEKPDILQCVT